MKEMILYYRDHYNSQNNCYCSFCIIKKALLKGLRERGFSVKLKPFGCYWDKYIPAWCHFNFAIEFHGKIFGDLIFELNIPSIGMREFADDFLDYICCASNHIKNAWMKAGIDEKRLIVIGNGLDTEIFNTTQEPDNKLYPGKFKFLTCGAWQPMDSPDRKGFEKLIRIFSEEFVDNKDVMLLIKTHGQVEELNLNGNVVLLKDYMTDLELAQMYRACAKEGAFVHLHKAEGFGRCLMESLHCGARIGATGYSGPLDFLNEKNATLFNYSLEELKNPEGLWTGFWEEHPKWADVNENEVRQWMHEVIKIKEENLYPASIHEHTWDSVIDNLIKQIYERI